MLHGELHQIFSLQLTDSIYLNAILQPLLRLHSFTTRKLNETNAYRVRKIFITDNDEQLVII